MKRKVIAVTGGIGSGKSEVCKLLREMGFATVDCDALARHIADEPQVVAAVEQLLGRDCVSNGVINRAKVREIVFADADLLKKYDEIFFERVRQRLSETVEGNDGTIFVEIPVIDAFEFAFDEIWLVESPEKSQIDRVTVRDKVSAENVKHIMKRQRYPKFTRVLVNDGSINELKNKVLEALSASGLAK